MRNCRRFVFLFCITLCSIAVPHPVSTNGPATAATPVYSWNLAVGDALIWNMTLLDDTYYVMHVVADFNSTCLGPWWAEVLWTRQFKWNTSLHVWDFEDDQFKDAPQAFIGENQTWQQVAGAFMGYWNGFWADLPAASMVGWFALPMGGAVNTTYQNSSMVNFFALMGNDPANFETTVNGLHWTARNISANVIVYDYTWHADGRLAHGIQRNWTNDDVLFEAVFVSPPVVTLTAPQENAAVAAGDTVNCAVVVSGETTLKTVKYYWSDSGASPDWSSQGKLIADPMHIPVASGLGTTTYLHIQAIDELGQQARATFHFTITGGISGFPIFLVGLAAVAGVLFKIRRRSSVYEFH